VQADVTVAVLGAHHSEWNQRYELLPHDDDRVGTVVWDGTIKYSPRDVIEPLQEMFDRAQLQHDTNTLEKYREAVRIVLHENIHLLAGQGTSLAFPLDAYEGKAHKALEEGLTELATHNQLNDYIEALDLERIAPGISRVQIPRVYAAYVPAVETLSKAIGSQVGLEPAEVVHRMAVVNAAEKFPVAAELLYAKHLSELVPETAKADSIKRIAEAMHGPFAEIHDYDPKDRSDVRLAALAGLEAVDKAETEIRKIAEHWSANQELRRALDAGLGATTPLQKTQRDSEAHQGPEPVDGPSGQAPRWNATQGERRRPAPGPVRSSRD
jgi:hypothetical protein